MQAFMSINNVPRRIGRMKTEFIDVDLVRGSTFTKAKPQVPWTRITQRAVLRVMFFPLYYKWWIQQTSRSFWLAMLVLYTFQLVAIVLYISNVGEYLKTESVTISEVSFPALLMLILGLMHSQTVLAHFSHKPTSRDGLLLQRENSKSCRKRSSKIVPERKPSFETAHKLSYSKKCDGRKRREYNLNSRKNSNSRWNSHSQPDADSNSASDEDKECMNLRLSQCSSSSSSCKSEPVTHSDCLLPNILTNDPYAKKNSNNKVLTQRNVEAVNRTYVVLGNCIYSRKLEDVNIQQTKVESLPSIDTDVTCKNNSRMNNTPKVVFQLNKNRQLHRSRSLDDLHSSSDIMDLMKSEPSHNKKSNQPADHELMPRKCSHLTCDTRTGLTDTTKQDIPFKDNVQWSLYHSEEDCTLSSKIAGDNIQALKGCLENGGLRQRHGKSKRKSHTRNVSPLSYATPLLKSSLPPSSSDGETVETLGYRKPMLSSEEWDDRMHSDIVTSSFETSSCTSEAELSKTHGQSDEFQIPDWNVNNLNVINLLQSPGNLAAGHGSHIPPPDKVSCVIWEGDECQKVDLTALHISWVIIEKVEKIPDASDSIFIGLFFSLIMGLVPPMFRTYNSKEFFNVLSSDGFVSAVLSMVGNGWKINLILINAVIQRLCLSALFFFLLSVADRTFKQRLLYAKYFSYLTSSRGARKFDLPHFRLNKVCNIKTWLSLRSYLKKRGPQRSVDVIVSASFLLAIISVTLMCLQLLKDTETFMDYLYNWELLAWSLALGVYILRFMTLGLKINQKYRNLSVLITEQINLYLQMEQKPHKKEKLMLANSVLKLAEDLLKELESPFKISGLSANPFLYNLTKVVVLSAFSGVLSELLGFKLKLYKIKFKT
ncbi:putative homeodomain transcription factor 2 isoform X3 [Octopus sinensis]|uniref:Homeodomain transcription factor 2 isoform X3 n=1 Tax=Octopus sinensis TaxID=2607531 RepID=A0A6P7S864_9MOLL|nr:putative homeodomain transcription factor 2 isoform X3 [Octopus sinensis]